MEWRPISFDLPHQEVLLWTAGRCAIGILVADAGAGGRNEFMDRWNDSLLPWPTHWMPLPDPPAE